MTEPLEVTGPLEQALRDQLAPALRRERWRRRWQAWALIAAGALLAAVALTLLEERTGLVGGRTPWALLGLALVAALVVTHRRIEGAAPDLRAIARKIEAVQPDLRALLLTAVAQAPEAGGGGRLGYLQEQVVREAVARAAPEAVTGAVSPARLWGTAAAFGVGLAGALLLAGRMLVPELAGLFPDEHGITVSPGDTEAERGTTVLVLARFTRQPPSRSVLVVRVPGKAPARLEMSKNLDDPVFGATTPAVEKSFEYQIEYASGRRTRRYRVAAFDLPDVDRVDALIAYPKQPGHPPRELKDVRRVSVVEGVRLTLTFHLNTEAGQARLFPVTEKGRGQPVALKPVRGDAAVQTVSLEPTRTVEYELDLADRRGRAGHAPAHFTVLVERNLPPEIVMAFPGRDARVSPLEELALEAKIADDVAVVGHGVSYRLVGKPAREVRLGGDPAKPAPGPGARLVSARHLLALEGLGAAPDDLVTYHFWAEDVGPDGKRRRASGDMYFAEVRPFEEWYREGMAGGGGGGMPAGGGGPAGELVRLQKEIINATWRLGRDASAGRPLAELGEDIELVKTQQEDVKELAESPRQREAAESLGATAALNLAIEAMKRAAAELGKSALGPALDAENDAHAALLRLRQREHQVTRGRGGGGGGGQGREESQAMDQLELKQKESRYETRSEATAEERTAREDRQVLSRLRELAERQKAVTERIRELQLALAQARAEEREELQRRLKRLREDQQELLGDLDELVQRMDQPDNRTRLGEARDRLERTRGRAAEASEALARGEAGRAVSAGTRAETELEQTRRELQRQVSSAQAEEMRALRDEARKLAEAQAPIGEALARSAAGENAKAKAAAPPTQTEARRLAQALRRQKDAAGRLLERMKKVTEESETSAPLLSRRLYDTLRKARTDGLEPALDRAGDMLEQNLAPQAAVEEQRARRAIAELEAGVGQAARGVLGDEAEALRLAKAELDALVEEARREQQGQGQGQAQGQQSPPGQQRGQGQRGRQGGGAPGEGSGQEQPGAVAAGSGPGAGGRGPITGEGFRAWADRLRDVEELVGDARLRSDAARIRDRARALRGEWQRHAERPQWTLLESQVVSPLVELRDRVSEELSRVSPGQDKLAPIDRDPVPSRFTDLVRRYYRSLAGE